MLSFIIIVHITLFLTVDDEELEVSMKCSDNNTSVSVQEQLILCVACVEEKLDHPVECHGGAGGSQELVVVTGMTIF